jgi:release factor glutamine methyltransferase
MTPALATSSVGEAPAASLCRLGAERLAAAGIPTARQDAESLLARVLGTTRLGLYTAGRSPLPDGARPAFEALLARRARHEPLQYLLGQAEFSGLVLHVGPGVFIPRPETEGLVEHALAIGPPDAATVLEVGTGSGAIAAALASRRPEWTVWATEGAAPAMAWARTNVRRLGLERRVRVLEGAGFTPLRGRVPSGTAALVVANPPYLATPLLPTLPVEVREWEPRDALDGGVDGLDVIRPLLAAAPEWLSTGGALLVEIGEEHGPAALALVGGDGRYAGARVLQDFRGCDRVLEARRR